MRAIFSTSEADALGNMIRFAAITCSNNPVKSFGCCIAYLAPSFQGTAMAAFAHHFICIVISCGIDTEQEPE